MPFSHTTDSQTRVLCKDEDIVAQSRYLVTNHLKETISVPLRESSDSGALGYTITCCLEKPGIEGQFELLLASATQGVEVQHVKVLPPNRRYSIEGQWKSPFNGGYMSLNNPQVPLFVKQRAQFLITLKRIPSHVEPAGVIFFILPWNRRNKRRRSHQETDIVEKSAFILTNRLQHSVELDTGGYIIVPCIQNVESSHFELSVETFGDNVEYLLPQILEKNDQREDMDCADILGGMKLVGGVFYTEDPTPKLVEYLKEKNGRFRDSAFTPNDHSLYDYTGQRSNELSRNVVHCWKRSDDIFDNPALYIDGIDVHDSKQGSVGNCWLMQSIAALSLCPNRIMEIFDQDYNEYGVFSLRLYYQDTPHYVLLDDYFPCRQNGKPAFASSTDENEMWVSFLEKAIAKIFQSYEALTARSISTGLSYLTGGKITDMSPERDAPEDIWVKLVEYCRNNWIVGLCSRESPDRVVEKRGENGIVAYHAYSVLNAVEVPVEVSGFTEPVRLVKVRNTWGHSEWNGDWSDKSSLWTPEIAEYCGLEDKDDGVFFMPFDELLNCFQQLTFCVFTSDEYPHHYKLKTEFLPDQHGDYSSVFNPHVAFKVNRTSKFIVRAYLADDNMEPKPLRLFLCQGKFGTPRLQEEEIIHQSHYLITKKLLLECTLDASEQQYVVFASMDAVTPTPVPINFVIQSSNQIEFNVPFREYFCEKYEEVNQPWGISGGYMNLTNPKWRLHVDTETELVASIEASYNDDSMGMEMVLAPYPESLPSRLKKNQVLHTSGYIISQKLSLTGTIPAGDYLLLTFLQKKEVTDAKYSLEIKSNERVEVDKL